MKAVILLAILAFSRAAPADITSWLECEGCQVLFSFVAHECQEQSFQQKVVGDVNELCGKLPNSLIQPCRNGINEFQAQVFQALQNVANPDDICPAIGLCSSSSLAQVVAQLKNGDRDGFGCDTCKSAVGEVEKILPSADTLNKLLSYVQAVCSYLPTEVQATCNTVISQYGQAFVQDILNLLDPQAVCADADLCSSSSEVSGRIAAKPIHQSAGDTDCAICEAVFEEVYQGLQANMQTLTNLIGKLCMMLPSNEQSECNDFIQEYGPLIIAVLSSQLEPTKICGEVHACPPPTGSSNIVRKPFYAPPQSGALKDSCDICKSIATVAENYISANKDVILAGGENLCKQLGLLDNMCNTVLKSYEPQILEILVDALQPAVLCGNIKAC